MDGLPIVEGKEVDGVMVYDYTEYSKAVGIEQDKRYRKRFEDKDKYSLIL